MHFSSSVFIAALVGIAQAQTPEGFKPSVNTKLDVMFNSTAVKTPGELLSKQTTSTQPRIAISRNAVNSTETFVFVMLDLDVPPAQGNTTRRVLLHAMNTGFKASQQRMANGTVLLTSSETGPAAYLPPGPPATDTKAHRYVELLFAQPANLQVQASDFANTQARIGFDIVSFGQKNGLGAPLAANFFTVDGRAGASASGTATASGGIARNTLQPFEGAAGHMDMSFGLAGLLGGLAIVAV
ncbi:PEBP-like protein [Lentithecium fluviatile CBS 122367]|uniref:PEBP-like protein n=1 Tax=Lentithecium fluviatile CBS 122367 TaxID=1168545 RepID=A0A6G1J483_9PLEO|nr:PEBP-like protein [Lentithecium fluviatile CBS 122367]